MKALMSLNKNRFPAVVAVLVGALAIVTSIVTIAGAEGKTKVLTVGKEKGAEAVVGDKVAASLETGTKLQLVKPDGEVACTGSKIEGKVKNNPESGIGNAVIQIETITFEGCSSTLGGGSTWKATKVETLPFTAETEGTTGFKITESGASVEIAIAVETPAKVEVACGFQALPLKAVYQNASGELEINQKLEGPIKNIKNCICPFSNIPTWKAKYRKLVDETAPRKGEQIFLN